MDISDTPPASTSDDVPARGGSDQDIVPDFPSPDHMHQLSTTDTYQVDDDGDDSVSPDYPLHHDSYTDSPQPSIFEKLNITRTASNVSMK
jgi:hypothetical protein